MIVRLVFALVLALPLFAQQIINPKFIRQAGATNGQALCWDDANGYWDPCTVMGSLTTQEGDANVSTATTTLDFHASDFDITESPAGESNVVIASALTRDAEIDSISELEAFIGSVNLIIDTEIDSESELEALLTAVTNILTEDDLSNADCVVHEAGGDISCLAGFEFDGSLLTVTGDIDVSDDIEVGGSTSTLANIIGGSTQSGNMFQVVNNAQSATYLAIDSSGNVEFPQLDCTGNANGGALTADASGQVSCTDDDSGAGSGTFPLDWDTTSEVTLDTNGDADLSAGSGAYTVDTFADAATDTFDGVTCTANESYVLQLENAARTITLADSGMLATPDGEDIEMDEVDDLVFARCSSTDVLDIYHFRDASGKPFKLDVNGGYVASGGTLQPAGSESIRMLTHDDTCTDMDGLEFGEQCGDLDDYDIWTCFESDGECNAATEYVRTGGREEGVIVFELIPDATDVAPAACTTIPVDHTVTKWQIEQPDGTSTSQVVDIWRCTYADLPCDNADSIAGTEKPTLTAASKAEDTSLTTWGDLTLDADDRICAEIEGTPSSERTVVTLFTYKP